MNSLQIKPYYLTSSSHSFIGNYSISMYRVRALDVQADSGCEEGQAGSGAGTAGQEDRPGQQEEELLGVGECWDTEYLAATFQ